ncbi:phycobilisome linker polypeptide [Gloeocapsa sp. PCC 73106]|uniref:phycobilisome linker polypeptide n=1 Tax=Gloeocapsa sp. PCC 73106 TaxID=102232 RepID=UPI0002ABB519|nr:phycobilisome linker polypeptide [Gloeocapsa sp. PCC 73106]ELR96654.1 CpcD/allophycocyanin linker domain protein [Gloeocapsa sp. PCC 73106]
MLNNSFSISKSSSPSSSRVFVYEVTGLKQSNENDRNNYAIRSSGNVLIKVPYNRMNEEMLRISRMGGKIVSIRPLEVAN